MASLVQVTPPAGEPVTLAQAKAHLRVDITDDDTYITALITAAREYVERRTNRSILTQTWALYLDRFPPQSGPIYIPRPPLQSVTSIQFIDTGWNTNTVPGPSGGTGGQVGATYLVNVHREPGIVTPAWAMFWPPVPLQPLDSVIVTYQAGWTTANNVPARIIQAIYLLIANWYENREPVVAGMIGTVPHALDAIIGLSWTPEADNFLAERA